MIGVGTVHHENRFARSLGTRRRVINPQARIIEPTSKQDSLRVLQEAGIDGVSYPTINRRLPVYARDQWRQRLAAAFAAHARLGPAWLVLYDVDAVLRDRRR